MREIKFRVWFKRSGYMCYLNDKDYLLNSDGLYERYDVPYCGYDYRLVSPDEYELMQFTGLCDKNGKEIYEGNIVEATQVDDYFTNDKPIRIRKVITIDFVTAITAYIGGGPDGTTRFEDIEIIGNKWDNPELLEQ